MRTSDTGVAMIKRHEGLRLRAYLCPAGVWTIGYGSTRGVTPHLEITEAEANGRLRHDLEDAERAVSRLVTVPLAQPQFDALVSFTFNLGAGRLGSSTLLRKLNAGDYEGAAGEFPRWVNGRVNGRLVQLPGLVARRAEEAALFASAMVAPADPPKVDVEPTPVTAEHESVNQSGSVNAARAAAGAGGAITVASEISPGPETADVAVTASQALPWINIAQTYGPWVVLAVLVGAWLYIEHRRRRQIAEAKR